MKKFNGYHVKDDEISQMQKMMIWMDDNPDIWAYQIRSYKQFNSNDKHYHTKFNLLVQKWVDGKMTTTESVGDTLMDAIRGMKW